MPTIWCKAFPPTTCHKAWWSLPAPIFTDFVAYSCGDNQIMEMPLPQSRLVFGTICVVSCHTCFVAYHARLVMSQFPQSRRMHCQFSWCGANADSKTRQARHFFAHADNFSALSTILQCKTRPGRHFFAHAANFSPLSTSLQTRQSHVPMTENFAVVNLVTARETHRKGQEFVLEIISVCMENLVTASETRRCLLTVLPP